MEKKRMLFVISVYVLGILVDGAEAVLLGIGFVRAMTGGVDPASVQAWAVALALMTGWTILLAWGLARPVERRGLLLITLPVILLILAGNASGAIYYGEGLAPRWFRIFGGTLVFCLVSLGYAVAARMAPSPRSTRTPR
jgi:hypothetical protein